MERIICRIPLRWGDMDAYGHINNVQIVRILEEARVRAFGQPAGTGLPGNEPPVPLFSTVRDGGQTLVVEHRIRYVSALEYRNIPVLVETWVSSLKAASLELNYLVRDGVTGEACVKAATVLAFVSGESGGVCRITAEQRAVVAPWVADSVFGTVAP
ncbi:acyl-CoA thioesterase [Arthrobacter roseus]|uniref:acyl-CoA thioesterase n=1 Tax=Arthrobacter roseus TaxID=136274 RepID=UPI00196636AB|nr:thioesterase family protein [Arthrobacter roseus]MBM7847788.1 acyl-CoA thioester hydrolase [Arthrobacter roseus]